MSVATGQDVPHDTFGGTLTEVGQSNMPSGGSPDNLNVEFLPGLVRTRGGAQVAKNYTLAGGPYQVRYTKSYEIFPEAPSQLSLLSKPSSNQYGYLVDPLSDEIGVVVSSTQRPWSPYAADPGWSGPLARSITQFGREYFAFSGGPYGSDMPRQWDGTHFDRVSQCGPGAPPTAADYDLTTPITSLTETDGTGISIVEILPVSDTVADVIVSTTLPVDAHGNILVQAGDIVKIAGNTVGGYNGNVTVINILGPGGFQISTPNLG